jgi:hypothetical protein
VAGLHTSRVLFMFGPLNAHSGVLLLVLASAAVAFHPAARRWNWVYFPLTLAAMLLLESGLLIVPVVAALWLTRAPGASARAVVACIAALVAYGAIRLGLGQPVDAAAAYTHSGLGFSGVEPQRLDEIFRQAPWLFWLYNVSATVLTVALSEPREGTYLFVQSLLQGNTPPWLWFHVLSSMLTTGVIVYGLASSRLEVRDRQVASVAWALIVFGSLLGFLYTRDRIGLPVGVGYALLLSLALTTLLTRPVTGKSVKVGTTAVLAVLAAAWVVRDVGMAFYLRDIAWEHRREWTIRYEDIRAKRPPTELLARVRSAALSRIPANASQDPPWTYELFERKFDRAPLDDVKAVDDGALAEAVRKALAADALVAAAPLEVDARNGYVRLMSDATNAEQRARAVAIARSVEGVKEVEDRMR